MIEIQHVFLSKIPMLFSMTGVAKHYQVFVFLLKQIRICQVMDLQWTV